MKVFDCREERQLEETKSKGVLDRIIPDKHTKSAEEIFIQSLRNVLDNRFVMLCNVCLEGESQSLPLILVGPTGIWMTTPSEAKGVFKVNGEVWEQLEERTRSYKPIKPNPMTVVIQKSQDLANYLSSRGIEAPPIEPVVFFSDPGAHAETVHPAARIVLIDALSRFIATILATPIILEGDNLQAIVDELYCEREPIAPVGEIKDAYSLQELPAPKKPREPTRLEMMSREEPKVVGRLSKHLPFTRRQWLLLGLLIVVNLIIIFLLVFVVVVST